MRIGNDPAGHANKINHAFGQGALGLHRITNTLRVHNRHTGYRFDACCQVDEGLGWQCHRRHAVGQSVVSVGAGAHHTDKIDQPGFAHGLGDFFEVFVRQAVVVEFFATHPHTHGKITAYGLTNRFEYFDTKAHAVFKRTAPLIGPFIGAGRPELIHQMLVGTADFHTIQT